MKPCACGCGELIPDFAENGQPRKWVHGHQQKIAKTIENRDCACGCGTPIPSLDRKNRPRRFLNGHNQRAKSDAQRASSARIINTIRPAQPWNKGRSYVIGKRSVYATKGSWAKALFRVYGSACMRCGWDDAPCDAHHIIPKSRGGMYSLDNGIILCPNCHRMADTGRITTDELTVIKAAVEHRVPVV